MIKLTNNMIKAPSPNFNDRPNQISVDMLVLHYTGMPTAHEALERMCDPVSKVSAHYMIDERGKLYHLVAEDKRAWHAGVSSWRGNNDINDRSVGIELANPGHAFGYHMFPKIQIDVLIKLAKNIILRHPIPARNVVGHSDIAPIRKQDPGELFEWSKLASHGIGLWPNNFSEQNIDHEKTVDFDLALKMYGYETANLSATTLAFQRHFLPSACSGHPDPETRKKLQTLLNTL
jgi:N-acetylmuramoyl-L-alanine amidase